MFYLCTRKGVGYSGVYSKESNNNSRSKDQSQEIYDITFQSI